MAGTEYPNVPAGTPACPAGMTYLGTAVSGNAGTAALAIPSTRRARVCVYEVKAPHGYTVDATVHCNSGLTASDTLNVSDLKTAAVTTVVTPTAPVAPNPTAPTHTLAFTGGPISRLLAAGLLILTAGVALAFAGAIIARRRRAAARS